MPVVLLDTFTDTNGVALDAHTGESATWARATGDESGGGAGLQITGNRAVATATNSNISRYRSVASVAADAAVSCTFVVPNNQNGSDLYAVWVRHAAAANTGYCFRFFRSTNALQLLRVVAGAETQLGSNVGGLVDNSTYTLTLAPVGTTIACRVQRASDSFWLTSGGTWQASQVDCLSQTDSSITGDGHVAISIRNATTVAEVDSVQAETTGAPVDPTGGITKCNGVGDFPGLTRWVTGAYFGNRTSEVLGDVALQDWLFDAAAAPLGVVTSSFDAAVSAQRSASTGVSASVAAPSSLQASIDAALQLARTVAAGIDAPVQAAAQAQASVSAAVQASATASSALGAAVADVLQQVASVQAAIAASGSVGGVVDVVAQALRTDSAAIDVAAMLVRSASASISAQVQGTTALSALLEVAVQRNDASLLAAVQAAVMSQGSAVANIAGAVSIQSQVQALLSAAVMRGDLVATVALQAYIQAGSTAAAGLSVGVMSASAISSGLDAAISRALTATASISANVTVAAGVSSSLSAVVQRALLSTAAAEVAIMALKSAQASLSAAVAIARQATAALEAAVSQEMSAQVGMASAILAASFAGTGLSVLIATQAPLVAAAPRGGIFDHPSRGVSRSSSRATFKHPNRS